MKKAQTILACAFSLFVLGAKAQQVYFNNLFDYNNELQFAKGIQISIADSSYKTISRILCKTNS